MFLGIDLGTSGVKAVILDARQKLVAEASSRPLAVTRAHSGWSEQDPSDWWQAVCEVLDRLTADHPAVMAGVEGIGLSGQMYGATLLGADDRPLRPAILWNNTRSISECEELEQAVPDLRTRVWRRPTPGVTATKLLWVRRHEPELFAKICTILLPKDYIRLCLSGEKASDLADSSGTMWVDLSHRAWSDPLLAACGLNLAQMPRLYEGIAPTGRLRTELAKRWKMAVRPVIAAGGGDNSCGACGTGVIEDGLGTVSLGTSGVLFLANDSPRDAGMAAVETLCHSVPDRWFQMSVVLSATSCLTWLATQLKKTPAELATALGDAPRPASDLIFVPYLDGCWSPMSDGNIRGGFLGLSHQHDDTALTQAVMQGVGCAILACADAFRDSGSDMKRLLAIGGGSRSGLWLSMLATLLQVELDVPVGSELGAAFGAARLGMIATGNFNPGDVLTRPQIRDTIGPEAAYTESYAKAFKRWKTLARLC